MSEDKNCYVYLYIRPYNFFPAYVGKGSKTRIDDPHRNKHLLNVIRKSKRLGLKIIKKMIAENLTETEALNLEIELIAKIGRKDLGLGPLCNNTFGGEGVSGLIHSTETKRRMSEIRLGEKNHFYGKKHPEETLKKMKGRKMSKEAIDKMQISRGEFKHTEETKKRIGKSLKGRTIKPETIEKRKISRKGYIHSEETKTKLKEAWVKRRLK